METLAARLEGAGIERVTGRVYGDESRFDSHRGGPDVEGQLSALAFNRGFASSSGARQANPPLFAAKRLDAALERRGVSVAERPRTGRTPASANILASIDSPPIARLIRITNKPSDSARPWPMIIS